MYLGGLGVSSDIDLYFIRSYKPWGNVSFISMQGIVQFGPCCVCSTRKETSCAMEVRGFCWNAAWCHCCSLLWFPWTGACNPAVPETPLLALLLLFTTGFTRQHICQISHCLQKGLLGIAFVHLSGVANGWSVYICMSCNGSASCPRCPPPHALFPGIDSLQPGIG